MVPSAAGTTEDVRNVVGLEHALPTRRTEQITLKKTRIFLAINWRFSTCVFL